LRLPRFWNNSKKGCGDMDEFEPLAGVEAPNDWIGGLLTIAVLFFAYALVG
jgi:hypothetical protein